MTEKNARSGDGAKPYCGHFGAIKCLCTLVILGFSKRPKGERKTINEAKRRALLERTAIQTCFKGKIIKLNTLDKCTNVTFFKKYISNK